MKICAISDIHGVLIDIPECDVLCIAGDIVELSIQRDSKRSKEWFEDKFVPWINKLPCKKVIVTPGNHDFLFFRERNYRQTLEKLTNDKFRLLVDELYEYEGITFYGTPWITPIHWQTWAFEYDDTIVEPYKNIPQCDILISHDSPNHNDYLDKNSTGKFKHHFFGHWHDGISYGHLNQHNCSILSDSYMLRENLKIVTIDIDGN